jgi:signal transduction histidine kinase
MPASKHRRSGRAKEIPARNPAQPEQGEVALLQYQQELRSLTARLISAQEIESRRLARELHDVFCQKLAVLGMNVTALEQASAQLPETFRYQLRRLGLQITELGNEIQQMSRQMHPAILNDLGLPAALESECLTFSRQYGIPLEFRHSRVPPAIPDDISLCLYRVTQECLRNIAKHARENRVSVVLAGSRREITLVVQDVDGGFDPVEVRGKGGLGLISMEERVRYVKGTFSIQSRPGVGTTVRIRIPLEGVKP